MARKTIDFESQLKRLQAIVTRLEEEDLPLEEGMGLFKEGVELVKSCRVRLREARNQVQVYVKGVLVDFEPDGPEGEGTGNGAPTTEDL